MRRRRVAAKRNNVHDSVCSPYLRYTQRLLFLIVVLRNILICRIVVAACSIRSVDQCRRGRPLSSENTVNRANDSFSGRARARVGGKCNLQKFVQATSRCRIAQAQYPSAAFRAASDELCSLGITEKTARHSSRRIFHIHAVMAAVPIYNRHTPTSATSSYLLSSCVPSSLPLSSNPCRPTTDSSSPPAILRLRRPPSCSYIVAAAARKHNYVGFLFPRLFFTFSSRGILAVAATVAAAVAAAATFYDRGLFSVKVCEVIRECGRIRAAAPVSPPALSPSLRTCPDTHGGIMTSDNMDLAAANNG